jgi:proline iminopeptidase
MTSPSHPTQAQPTWADRSVGAPDRPSPAGPDIELPGFLRRLWADRRLRLGAAVGVAGLWALVAGMWTPRGPLTSGEALWAMLLSLGVGVAAGLVMRSRWAMLIAPAVFVAVFEIVRIGTDGPMVDGIHLSMYGMIAFVTGRGLHAVLALAPMALGAAFGAGWARRLRANAGDAAPSRPLLRYTRRTVAVLTAVALAIVGVGIARPASTAPIVDADGSEVTGSVAELTAIDVNGHELGLMIRGHSVENPVLLFLAGGPGGSEYGAMRRHLPELERHFTVVTWDQRGTGTSYPELDPTDTVTLDGAIDDTVVVTDHLRDRFGQDTIYLLGQSWGTTLGVLAVQQHPERYAAFVGTGQMVSQRATDRIFYDDTLAWARANGNDALVEELVAIGEPPYDEMFPYETALANEQAVYPYDHSPNSEGEAQMSENLLVGEYTLLDQAHVLGAFMDTFSVLYPQLQGIDFRDTATEFDVPMFFVQGAHEARGRAALFDEWYPTIDAPIKDLVVLDTSGHRPLWEQPDAFVEYMVDTVLAQTAPSP